MSFKRNISSLLAVAGATVLVAGGAFAQEATSPTVTDKKADGQFKGEGGGRKFGKRHGFGMRGGFFRGLNLTDAQKEQIKQIREANKPTGENFEAIRALHKAKRDGTITADQEAQLKAFREQRRANAKQVREQLLAILTPEQKAQLEQRKAEMKQRREEFKQKRELRRQEKQNATPKVG